MFNFLNKNTEKNVQLEIALPIKTWERYKEALDEYELDFGLFMMNCDDINFIESNSNDQTDYYQLNASYLTKDISYYILKDELKKLQSIISLTQLFSVVDVDIDKMIEIIKKCPILSVQTSNYKYKKNQDGDYSINIQYLIYCY